MSSVCISKCMNDARDPRVPVRATYVNLYKWPESDAEFVRSVSSRSSSGGGGAVRFGHPRVVDSISCRQMYLRSYKFSREEDTVVPDNTHKYCFGHVSLSMLGHKKNKANLDDHQYHHGSDKNKNKNKNKNKKKKKKKKRCLFLGKVRDVSRAAFFGIFRSCLACTATVDVVDQRV